MTDAELARTIAVEAGALLLAIRRSGQQIGHALGDRADREANGLILERLHSARPNDFILSEESLDDRARCAASRVWIVDPLDGTREYAEGLDDWAVHIGLAVDGDPTAGAVAIPALGRVYTTDDPAHTCVDCDPLTIAVSRTRAPEIARLAAEAIGASMLPMGSAGAKAMAVVDGRADAYLHDGGQYEWDNCAPAAVAIAAGLHASRIDGSPLRYNCENPLLPDLLICRPEIASAILTAIAVAKGW